MPDPLYGYTHLRLNACCSNLVTLWGADGAAITRSFIETLISNGIVPVFTPSDPANPEVPTGTYYILADFRAVRCTSVTLEAFQPSSFVEL